jgi:hypothetical protein
MRDPMTHSTRAGPSTAATASQASVPARACPASGCRRDDHRDRDGQQHRPGPLEPTDPVVVARAFSVSANNSEVTSSACTNSTDPAPRRGLQPEAEGGDQTAHPPAAVAQQPQEQLQMADVLVGDLVRGALVDDVPMAMNSAAPSASSAAISALSKASSPMSGPCRRYTRANR